MKSTTVLTIFPIFTFLIFFHTASASVQDFQRQTNVVSNNFDEFVAVFQALDQSNKILLYGHVRMWTTSTKQLAFLETINITCHLECSLEFLVDPNVAQVMTSNEKTLYQLKMPENGTENVSLDLSFGNQVNVSAVSIPFVNWKTIMPFDSLTNCTMNTYTYSEGTLNTSQKSVIRNSPNSTADKIDNIYDKATNYDKTVNVIELTSELNESVQNASLNDEEVYKISIVLERIMLRCSAAQELPDLGN
uniref:Secreted protein n=1 Tax=Ditylenchus dipsaci TaxID=166011 RepID=A0A915CWC0_9BILA